MAQHIKTRTERNANPVRYMDGASLKRPLDLPRTYNPILIALVAAAAILGIWMGVTIHDNVTNAQAREEATVEAATNRGITLDVPIIDTYVALDNAGITNTLSAAGFTTVDMNTLTGSTSEAASGSLDLIKLPSDMTAADAAVMYAKGISNLSATDAAKFLSGTWRLTVDRSEGLDIKVKYTDFKSGSATAAIQSAMTTEGWTTSTLGDAGTDSAGNTYQKGTILIDGVTYNWSVSVCDLSEVYSIDGMPSTAQYVGIRITQ